VEGGKRVTHYLGVVTGEAVLGANLFRDLFAGIRDIVGGRSGAYEKELRKARDLAFEELQEAAAQLGANAVVGIDIDYEVLGEKNGMADGQSQWHGGHPGIRGEEWPCPGSGPEPGKLPASTHRTGQRSAHAP
jgi:uncharacterized protein YbjQ (UPF0145 family)